jgi:hypothetical protein
MEGFFTFVLVLILLFWLLGRVAPFILAWWVRKKFRHMEQEQKRYKNTNREFKEGDVLVEVEKEDRKVVDSSVGEYVDFEETK